MSGNFYCLLLAESWGLQRWVAVDGASLYGDLAGNFSVGFFITFLA